MDFLLWFCRSEYWLPCAFVLGACIGSFLNVFAWRYPQMMQRAWLEDIQAWFDEKSWELPSGALAELAKPRLGLALPASHCPHCSTPLSWRDNIPIFGWLFLRGRARCCKARIGIKYPLAELVCACLTLATALIWQARPLAALGAIAFTWTLVAISLIDFESMLIPDEMIILALLIGICVHLARCPPTSISLPHALWGALLGYGLLQGLRLAASWIMRKEAMGGADPKLLGAIGFFLGWQALLPTLLLASLLGLAAAVALRSKGPMPFGPYLAMGGWLSMVFATSLNQWLY